VAIVANAATAGQGAWQYSTNSGSTWVNVPTSGLEDAKALVLPATSTVYRLRFLPALDFNGNPGELSVRLADGSGAGASTAFSTLTNLVGSIGGVKNWSADTVPLRTTINPVNDPPAVSAIADQSVDANRRFDFTVPANTFADVDTGDTLRYAATLADGKPLPGWLSFNAATRAFSGTPGANDASTVEIRVAVTDSAGAGAADTFRLTVNPIIVVAQPAPVTSIAVQVAAPSAAPAAPVAPVTPITPVTPAPAPIVSAPVQPPAPPATLAPAPAPASATSSGASDIFATPATSTSSSASGSLASSAPSPAAPTPAPAPAPAPAAAPVVSAPPPSVSSATSGADRSSTPAPAAAPSPAANRPPCPSPR
jgi:hypothetical protein